jgi:hypothetical protein
MPGVVTRSKHIAVHISTATAILMRESKEITKTLLNPSIVHYDPIHCRKIWSCRGSILVVRNKYTSLIVKYRFVCD